MVTSKYGLLIRNETGQRLIEFCQGNALVIDILGVDIHRPKVVETTALGAAYLSGLAVGFYANKEDIKTSWIIDREFTPQMSSAKRNVLYKGWKKAVSRTLEWAKEDEELQKELAELDC